ncbi:MAG: Ig-like domain-containing protein, partial [Methanobrevibacter sp.]|nr:Ig-like domain-containing protein [Methanobrevibacter sp.]
NCNFTGNTATYNGGAVFRDSGSVENCNFTGNTASGDGGAVWMKSGNVTNCNFTANTANENGGAVQIDSGIVENCNFAGNFASQGGSIFDGTFVTVVTADTCIFKTDSDAPWFTLNLPPTLNVDNFTTVYGSCEKLTFDLKTNINSIPVTNGNISISVYFKGDGQWVRNYTCLSGEGWIPDLPVGSYIAVFNTEYAEFQPINRTVTITMPNVRYSINVTSFATNNRTVNITVKSDIPKDILWDGKLLFIVPNTNPINATYAGNGTWWAVYTFADYGEYEVNATFEGLENVTVNNATISISKIPTNITVNTVSLELFVGDETVIVATLTPGDAGNVTFKSSDDDIVLVEDNGNVIANGEGQAIITVSFAGNDKYAAANKTINVTVKLNNANVTVDKDKLDLKVGETYTINATKRPDTILLDITYTSSNTSVASVDKNGVVTAVGEGTAIITVSVGDDEIYALNSTNVTVRVSKVPTEITALDVSAVYNADNYLIVNLKDSTGKALTGVKVSVDLNGMKEYTTDSNGQVKVSTKGLAPNTYAVKIAFNGNAKYDKSVKEVKVTVKKATPKIIAKKKTYKAKSAKKFKITLKDNTGKPIKNAKVRLIVKKIAKKAKKSKAKTKTKKKKNILKTNKKGKATFKVKRNKKGKYIATVKYYGNKYFKAVTKKVKITIK